MLTVAAALEQGREVMSVPGPITAPTSAGTNQLLRDGADPVLHPDDLLAKFAVVTPARSVELGPLDPPPCNLTATEARVFDTLTVDARHVDDLTLAVGLPVGEVLGRALRARLGGTRRTTAGKSLPAAASGLVMGFVRRAGVPASASGAIAFADARLPPRSVLRAALFVLRFRHRRPPRDPRC